MPGEGDGEDSMCALCGACVGMIMDHEPFTCVVQLILLVMTMLILAYALLEPVRVTVSDASLSRFALNNGTGTSALAYDLSLAVSVRNPNWAMRAQHAAPLHADLRFAGRSLAGARLADAGRSVGADKTEELRLRAAGEKVLDGDGVAEVVKETEAGQLELLELKITGKVRYRPVHVGRYRLAVTCPLRLPTTSTNVIVQDKEIKCH